MVCSSCDCPGTRLVEHKRQFLVDLVLLALTCSCLKDAACESGRPERAETRHICWIGGGSVPVPPRPGLERVRAAQPHYSSYVGTQVR